MPHDNSAQTVFRYPLCAHDDTLDGKGVDSPSQSNLTSYRPDLMLEVAPSVTGLLFLRERCVLYHEHGCWSRNYNYSFDELIDLGQRYGLPFDLSQGDAVALKNGFSLACRASEEDKICKEAANRRWSDAINGSMTRIEPNQD